MSQKQTAQRYAQALYEVVPPEERQDVQQEFQQVMEILEEDSIKVFFFHPKTPLDQKRKLISTMQLHPSLHRFLMLVLEKSREHNLAGMAAAFRARIYADAGIRTATVSSAVPLDETTVEDIRQRLTKLTGAQTIEVEIIINEDLWGGLVIEMDGKVIDGSLATQLERFRQSLSSQS